MTDEGLQPGLQASVAICTRNRADSLARTLVSVAQAARHVSAPFSARWELVVVDNGSTDNTAAVVASFADRLPIRRVEQPLPGLSNARNAGMAAARGAVILWTDDDVLVDEGWLAAHLAAFERHPEAGIFGGRAVPRFEEPQQAWFIALAPYMEALLAIRDCPDWDQITPDRLPYGLNYAVRTDVQRRFPYDPNLGVAPGRRIGGEETGMIKAALAAGVGGRWTWDATVYHLISPQRQSLAYVRDYYQSQGRVFPSVPVGTAAPVEQMRRFSWLGWRMARRLHYMWRLRRRGDGRWILSYMDYARLRGSWARLARGLSDDPKS